MKATNYDSLEKSIIEHEGYRRYPYQDILGKWTVGYGHLIHNDRVPGLLGEYLNHITAPHNHTEWLFEDIRTAEHTAKTWLGSIYDDLDDTKQEVVIEMAFQLGNRVKNFILFKEALSNKNYIQATKEMENSAWYKQTPNRVDDLIAKMLK